ncbi:hypothetical protein [His 1 virus]|uniref:Putative transmembrane protein ORF23 n=1 Tax=His1 virus (isolate Australia/Victoria) TaxID=654912 RepID=Y023_HIS1I|nr:hypothetical protein His1V_gp23 [His 1 virus]Q25BH2.1 RecName: Full=Putative transmembrane protein ORF23; Flags: Precursor [His1 virus (isolate Victoria)]AAQ13738.1 hypothetical protein [His 1 virus]
MVIILLGVSIVVPGLFLATETPQTNTFEQTELERATLTGEVSTEVTQVTNQEQVNITVLNRRDGTIDSTGELQVGESANLTISGETITVEIIDVIDTDNVLVRYTYPLYVGWPSGAETIITNIADIIIMATAVMIIGAIYTGYKVSIK